MRGSLNRRTAHNETVDDYRIYWWYMLAAGGLLNIELCTAWHCCICKLLCKRHPHEKADDWRPIRTGTAVSIGLTFFFEHFYSRTRRLDINRRSKGARARVSGVAKMQISIHFCQSCIDLKCVCWVTGVSCPFLPFLCLALIHFETNQLHLCSSKQSIYGCSGATGTGTDIFRVSLLISFPFSFVTF